MKTWIKRALVGLAVAGTLFGGLVACAHSHHGLGWRAMSEEDAAQMKTRVVDRIGSKLDLDTAQKAKLGVLADTLRAQRNALVGSMGGKSTDPRAEVQGLIAGSTLDRAKAKALIDAKLSAVTTQSPAVVAAMADFYDSVKSKQQAEVREFMASRGHRGNRS